MIRLSRENADMAGSYPAMLRAAQRAREIARMYKTPLILWQNGKIVEIPPDEIEDLPKELLKIARWKRTERKTRANNRQGASWTIEPAILPIVQAAKPGKK